MNKSPANILIGAKMGDFMHCMYVPFHLWKNHNIKSNIFISEIGDKFDNGLDGTFNDLKPILEQQEYVADFKIWDGQHIDYYTPLFRNEKYVYTKCWKDLLCSLFLKDEKPLNGGWLKFNEQEKLTNTLVINRRNRTEFTKMFKNAYQLEIKKFSKVIFAGSKKQYDEFELKDLCEHFEPKSLSEWFSIISKGTFFLGNQSGPAAIACALDVPRLIEILPSLDGAHYYEEFYSDNLSFINPFKICRMT